MSDKECLVASDPTGNTPLWLCDCPECIALESALDDDSDSAAVSIRTEDGKTVTVGSRVFNYYDCKWGTIADDIDRDGWFTLIHADGTRAILNGERISSYQPAHLADRSGK